MKKKIEIQTSKPARKYMRYNIMRMVNGNFDGPAEFEKNINKQIEQLGVQLKNFMINWDVSKDEPYKLVKI